MKVGNLEVTFTGAPQCGPLGPRVLVKFGTGYMSTTKELHTSEARTLIAHLQRAIVQAEEAGRVG